MWMAESCVTIVSHKVTLLLAIRASSIPGLLVVVMSGAFGSAWACRRVSHLPDLTPIDFALFPRAMPAANSGAGSPWSVAATAGVRMATCG